MLNGRFYIDLGLSPFFAIYSYDIPLSIVLDIESNDTTTLVASERVAIFVEKIRKITDIC